MRFLFKATSVLVPVILWYSCDALSSIRHLTYLFKITVYFFDLL